MSATPATLQNFVQYCQDYIKGDEKSESQTFLTKLFQAFGHGGIEEVGAEFEQGMKYPPD
ncbi:MULTISPECIES: hypothetical protein [unclassified Synechocystis]|uniref:hypothetical protein n=1 Tax=unclassified Synechocystis TaxID=2640012 RepID=UPI0004249013|nr:MULTISPECIES: hypothetical protein [unclassified Synechocystis]AIE75409.1 hypothetical protein D082_28810 [Synechocystis sp. PCC 6714]MCT0253636.1 hypothetical protein [Synechocystis sp. CS-94]